MYFFIQDWVISYSFWYIMFSTLTSLSVNSSHHILQSSVNFSPMSGLDSCITYTGRIPGCVNWQLAICSLMNVSPHCRMVCRHCELTKQETSCLLTTTPSGALIMSVCYEIWSLPAGMLGCAACCVGCVHHWNHWSSIVNHDYRLVGASMAWLYYSEIYLD